VLLISGNVSKLKDETSKLDDDSYKNNRGNMPKQTNKVRKIHVRNRI